MHLAITSPDGHCEILYNRRKWHVHVRGRCLARGTGFEELGGALWRLSCHSDRFDATTIEAMRELAQQADLIAAV